MKAKLLKSTIINLLICIALVVICYFFVDRTVADFVHKYITPKISIPIHHVKTIDIITFSIFAAPIIIVILALVQCCNFENKSIKTIFIICVNLLVTVAIKNELKFAFGRFWPTSWIKHNPSWIRNHAYGFHPFHLGIAYQSFPSGHTTVAFAIASIVWLMYPKLRILAALACAITMIGLIALNYHFVSDVIAGAFLGALTGRYAVCLSGLQKYHNPKH